jgi:hypothetical protein
MRSSFAFCLVSFLGGVACHSNAAKPDGKEVDAKAIDATPDAPVADRTWNEGGGTTLEYQTIFVGPHCSVTTTMACNPTGNPTGCPTGETCLAAGQRIQARITAYWWSMLTPLEYPFPPTPGCVATGMATPTVDANFVYPWGMGALDGSGNPEHTYRDVGQPIITGLNTEIAVPLGANPGVDGESRKQNGIWHFFVDPTGGSADLPDSDATYSLITTGAADGSWPAAIYKDAFYMPPAYTLGSPGFGPSQLIPDTDFVETWTNPTPVNLPAGQSILYANGFIVPGIGPVVICVADTANQSQITGPAAMVNFILSLGSSGMMGRALINHQIGVFDEATHQRQDFFTKWCYVTPWTAGT